MCVCGGGGVSKALKSREQPRWGGGGGGFKTPCLKSREQGAGGRGCLKSPHLKGRKQVRWGGEVGVSNPMLERQGVSEGWVGGLKNLH